MEPVPDGSLVRIGELSRRLAVSDHVLRVWESRYGLLNRFARRAATGCTLRRTSRGSTE
jgi:MerR HTH family regulatory protein